VRITRRGLIIKQGAAVFWPTLVVMLAQAKLAAKWIQYKPVLVSGQDVNKSEGLVPSHS